MQVCSNKIMLLWVLFLIVSFLLLGYLRSKRVEVQKTRAKRDAELAEAQALLISQ